MEITLYTKNAASTRLSLRGGVFYYLNLWGAFHITPGVYYDYGLTNVVTDQDWTMNAIFFQLDLMLKL